MVIFYNLGTDGRAVAAGGNHHALSYARCANRNRIRSQYVHVVYVYAYTYVYVYTYLYSFSSVRA